VGAADPVARAVTAALPVLLPHAAGVSVPEVLGVNVAEDDPEIVTDRLVRIETLTDPVTLDVLLIVADLDPVGQAVPVRLWVVDGVPVGHPLGVAERRVVNVFVAHCKEDRVTVAEAVGDLVPIADREPVALLVLVFDVDTDRDIGAEAVAVRVGFADAVDVEDLTAVLVGRTDTDALPLAVLVFDAVMLFVALTLAVPVELVFAVRLPVPLAVMVLEVDTDVVPVLDEVDVRDTELEPLDVFVLVGLRLPSEDAVPVFVAVAVAVVTHVGGELRVPATGLLVGATDGSDDRESVVVRVDVFDAVAVKESMMGFTSRFLGPCGRISSYSLCAITL